MEYNCYYCYMSKEEILDGMTIGELYTIIHKKEERETTAKYGPKKGVPFKIKEVDSLEGENSNGNLFHVRVDDGCEGWESLVEIDRDTLDDWEGDTEDLVHDHIINLMNEKGYYQPWDIEKIHVEEICSYGRELFKIYE